MGLQVDVLAEARDPAMVTEPETGTVWWEDRQDQKVERLERNEELLSQL